MSETSTPTGPERTTRPKAIEKFRDAATFVRKSRAAKAGIAAGLAVVLVAGGSAGAFAFSSASHEKSVSAYSASNTSRDNAVKLAAASIENFDAAKLDGAEHATATAVVLTSLTGIVDAELSATVEEKRAAYEKIVAETEITLPKADGFKHPFTKPTASKEAFEAGTEKLTKSATKLNKSSAAVAKATSKLTAARTALDEALLNLSLTVPELTDPLVAAHTDAVQSFRDDLATASSDVAAMNEVKESSLTALSNYAVAVYNLRLDNARAVAERDGTVIVLPPNVPVAPVVTEPRQDTGAPTKPAPGKPAPSKPAPGKPPVVAPPVVKPPVVAPPAPKPPVVAPPAPPAPPAPAPPVVAPPAPTLNASAKASALASQYGASTNVTGMCSKQNWGTASAHSSFGPNFKVSAPDWAAVSVSVQGDSYAIQWWYCEA